MRFLSRYKEKGELEALFFTIQTKRKAMGRKPYAPPQGEIRVFIEDKLRISHALILCENLSGLFMYDVESAWEKLDRAENDRQVSIIAELQRWPFFTGSSLPVFFTHASLS